MSSHFSFLLHMLCGWGGFKRKGLECLEQCGGNTCSGSDVYDYPDLNEHQAENIIGTS